MLKRQLVCIIGLFFSCYALSQTSLNESLNRLIAPFSKSTSVGVVVQSMQTQDTLFSYNPDQRFSPASVQKLYTAVAALAYFPKDFVFKTAALSSAKIKNGVLSGNVYFKFSGDPSFTSDNLLRLIYQLKAKGIKKIQGNIYIDNTAFDTISVGPGWMADDLSYAFAAPLSAVIIDKNSFNLKIYPGVKENSRPKLVNDIPIRFASFNNQLQTKNKFSKNCPILIYYRSNNRYLLKGCAFKRKGYWLRTLSIQNPVQFAKLLIAKDFKSSGIVVSANVLVKKTPKTANILVEHKSLVLLNLVVEMLKESDNLIADALLKTLGAQYYHQPGSWQNGVKALEAILEKQAGIDFKNILLVDGAGLSRYNLSSPAQISKLLYFAYQRESIRKDLLTALPIGGLDGTLKYRFTKKPYKRNVIAKTGTMAGVTSLAGYVKVGRNKFLSCVVLINGFVGKVKPYSNLENSICRELIDHYKKT